MIAFLLLQLSSVIAQGPKCGTLEYLSYASVQGKLEIEVRFKDYTVNSPIQYAAIDLNIVIASKCGKAGFPKPFIIDQTETTNSLNLNVGGTPTLTFTGTDVINYSLLNLNGFNLPGTNPSKRLFSIFLIPTDPLEECCVVLDDTSFPQRDLTNGSITSSTGGPMLYFANGSGGVIACPVTTPANPFENFCNVPENALTISGTALSPLGACQGSVAPRRIPNVKMEFTRITPIVPSLGTKIPHCTNSTILTNTQGEYMSCDLPANNTYEVLPSKDCSEDPKCGLNTLDIFLISQHILGNQTLSWWQQIAADVEGSSGNSISGMDILKLRKILLGVIDMNTGFPHVFKDCWKFVPRINNYITNAQSLAGQPYVVNLANTNATNIDFVGIKMGDVSGECYCGFTKKIAPEGSDTYLTLPNSITNNGEIIDVPIRIGRDVTPLIYNADFDIDKEKFDVLALIPNESFPYMSNDCFNTEQLEEGKLKMLWVAESILALQSNQTMFTLRLRAKGNVDIREAIKLNEDKEHEYWSIDKDYASAIKLNFDEYANGRAGIVENGKFKATSTVSLIGESTYISFSMPKAGMANIAVYDQQGRLLNNTRREVKTGENILELDIDAQTQTGVFYYIVNNDAYQVSGRFVKVSY